jgi:phosphatidylglycerophosphatase A
LPSESANPNNPSTDTRIADKPPVPFVVKLFASGLMSGYAPFASGTFGSLLGLALYFIPGFEHWAIIIPACIVLFLLGIPASRSMEQYYGHDPSENTIDEILGMWISLLFLPKSLFVAAWAFLFFRFFDIVKPYPAQKFDASQGGFGIMMDDVIAGIYTNILIHILLLFSFFEAVQSVLSW